MLNFKSDFTIKHCIDVLLRELFSFLRPIWMISGVTSTTSFPPKEQSDGDMMLTKENSSQMK